MSATVKGIGPEAPIATNEAGGKQSATPYRCDLMPPLAFLAVSAVLEHGATKYGANNWHKIPVADHLNHALAHVFAHQAGDTQDDHLEHAACRLMMALEQKLAGRPKPEEPPRPKGDTYDPAAAILEKDMKQGILYRRVGRGLVEEVGPIKFTTFNGTPEPVSPFVRWVIDDRTADAGYEFRELTPEEAREAGPAPHGHKFCRRRRTYGKEPRPWILCAETNAAYAKRFPGQCSPRPYVDNTGDTSY